MMGNDSNSVGFGTSAIVMMPIVTVLSHSPGRKYVSGENLRVRHPND
jgi:hypothetical protein